MYSLSACPFQQVVNARDNKQFISELFQMNETLVGVYYLFQVDVLSTMCVNESSA